MTALDRLERDYAEHKRAIAAVEDRLDRVEAVFKRLELGKE